MRKSEKIQLVYLIIYFISLLTLVTLVLLLPSIYMILSFIGVLIIGWIGMYFVKSRVHIFKCNKCGKEFHPTLFQELSNRLFHKDYKHLSCPKCECNQNDLKDN